LPLDVYVRGKYRDGNLPMTVIRRSDAVLEQTKDAVLQIKKSLDEAGVIKQTDAICCVAEQAFCNTSPFTLKDLKSRSKQQQLKADFIA
jgi:type I restriction enzyme M protein